MADPRVRLKPHQRKGRTVIPLARHLGGHLIIAGHDAVLGHGEVAEFDTRIPPWFGSIGDEPAEVA